MYSVIIAEDEAIVRHGLKNMMNWEQYDMRVVADAVDGEEAYAFYNEHRPDVLITDIRMPRMDGISLIRKIREEDARIKIIILSCLDEFHLVQQALELSVSGYILKLTAGIEEIERILKNVKASLDKEGSSPGLDWMDMNLVKAQLLDDFLYFRTMTPQRFEAGLSSLPLRISKENLVVVLFVLSVFDQDFYVREGNERQLRNFVLDTVQDALTAYPSCECYCNFKKEYCLILSFPKLSKEEADQRKDEILAKVSTVIRQALGAEIIYGASSPSFGYGALPDMCAEAAAALADAKGSHGSLPAKVAGAVRYLREHYADNISLQSVAEHLGMTPNYLSHLFMQHLQAPFTDYLNRIRVDYAKKLLADPSQKIYSIGRRVGMYNTSYFIKVFKKFTGLTPNDYRNGKNNEE